MDVKTFLKQHSAIPNEFIDEFISMHTQVLQTEFSVNLNIVSKWLDVKIKELKNTLRSS